MKILKFVKIIYFSEMNTLSKNISCENYLKESYEKGLILPSRLTEAFALNGVDCNDVILDSYFLKQWCHEHQIQYESDSNAIKAIITQQKPDIIFFDRIEDPSFDFSFLTNIKSEFQFIKGIVIYVGTYSLLKKQDKTFLSYFDRIFCIEKYIKSEFEKYCHNCHVVRYGYDCLPNEEQSNAKKIYPFTFLGTSGHGIAQKKNRFEGLNFLMEHSPLQVWLYEPYRHLYKSKQHFEIEKILSYNSKKIKKLFKKIRKNRNYPDFYLNILRHIATGNDEIKSQLELLQIKPIGIAFKKNTYPLLTGDDYMNIIRQTKVSLNLHGTIGKSSGNFRVFEVTGSGSCLLTDRAEDLTDIFNIDQDIVGFSTHDEALEKFKYLNDHPNIAEKIALSGQKKVLEKHTIYHRAQEIINYLKTI